MRQKRNDEAYKLLWNELNFLEMLKISIDAKIDGIAKDLKEYKMPKE